MAQDLSQLPVKDGFRLRGESISRLETFVDAAFAFAVTLMVISPSGIPKSMDELVLALHRVPTMAACFVIMMMFWAGHDRWSRRYGLDNTASTFLSLALVLGVLVFVYPQRIILSGAMSFVTGGWTPAEVELHSIGQLLDVYAVYALGYGYLSGVLVLLDREALRHADELRLDALERLETKRDLGSHLIFLGSAVLSMALTFLARRGPDWLANAPGFAYMAIGPAMHFHHARFHRLRKRLPPREA